MSSTSAANKVAYDMLQTTMARQLVTVWDLYGLLGLSPGADEKAIREAYEKLSQGVQPEVPANVVNVAYSILANPLKRAQYDRDRLEYLYKNFAGHNNFPRPAESSAAAAARSEEIQVYAATLSERVRDPADEARAAAARRLARMRRDVDDFNDASARQRQDWPTSANRVLRMAGSALCEVVVVAEEELRRLEDELGRLDGILPAGPDGDGTDDGGGAGAGADRDGGRRVTSAQFGSEASEDVARMPSVLRTQRHPAIPRSPTMRLRPQSVSKTGAPAAPTGTEATDRMRDSSDSGGPGAEDHSSSGGEAETEVCCADDRVNDFLAGPTNIHLKARDAEMAAAGRDMGRDAAGDTDGASMETGVGSTTATTKPPLRDDKAKQNRRTCAQPSTAANADRAQQSMDDLAPSLGVATGFGMGLVQFQRLHGLRNPENLENDPLWAYGHTSAEAQAHRDGGGGGRPVSMPPPGFQQVSKDGAVVKRDFSAPGSKGKGGARVGSRGSSKKKKKQQQKKKESGIAHSKYGSGDMQIDDPFL